VSTRLVFEAVVAPEFKGGWLTRWATGHTQRMDQYPEIWLEGGQRVRVAFDATEDLGETLVCIVQVGRLRMPLAMRRVQE
jgi:hypothetical protein